MANHSSSIKRIRQTKTRKQSNKYHVKTVRNVVKDFRALKEKPAAQEQLPEVISKIDKLAKTKRIHKNKASNLKSKMMKKVNSL